MPERRCAWSGAQSSTTMSAKIRRAAGRQPSVLWGFVFTFVLDTLIVIVFRDEATREVGTEG